MNLMLSLACLQNGMLPEEAINAATINSAYAMASAKVTEALPEAKWPTFLSRKTRQLPTGSVFFWYKSVESIILNGH
jgi:imidazolonepropionase